MLSAKVLRIEVDKATNSAMLGKKASNRNKSFAGKIYQHSEDVSLLKIAIATERVHADFPVEKKAKLTPFLRVNETN